jgi:hypothetical protein
VRRAIALGAAALAAAAFAVPARADGGRRVDGEKTDCSELLPDEASPVLTDDAGGNITLSVFLLRDGVDPALAAKVARRARDAYAPLDISLTVVGGRAISLKPDPKSDAGEAQRLIDDARKQLGGRRPKGADVVFILTKKDIYEGAVGNDVVGFAACIGGVEDPTKAFAIGEVDEEPLDLGVTRMYVDVTAKILAHEIGHLLGAQHHYANCAEGVSASDITGRDLSPCSLMSNFVDFQSLRFDVLNGAVVRGHASSYARP